MKVATIVGIVLIVVGMVGLIYGGITYTSNTNEITIGTIELQLSERKTLPLPPVLGAASVIIGILVILSGNRRPK